MVLECRGLTKGYLDADRTLQVLKGLKLQVRQGEQVAIMGRSGSGKSTLLQLLGGLEAPTAGSVWIEGRDMATLSDPERDRFRNGSLGFIYQLHHLLPEFSALENVAMPLLIGRASPRDAETKATALLTEMGLGGRLHHRPSALSGGERQRVAIARALITRPRCILADEPTGSLDSEHAAHAFALLQSLNRRFATSIVLVTHDETLAKQMDRVLLLEEGQLLPC